MCYIRLCRGFRSFNLSALTVPVGGTLTLPLTCKISHTETILFISHQKAYTNMLRLVSKNCLWSHSGVQDVILAGLNVSRANLHLIPQRISLIFFNLCYWLWKHCMHQVNCWNIEHGNIATTKFSRARNTNSQRIRDPLPPSPRADRYVTYQDP